LVFYIARILTYYTGLTRWLHVPQKQSHAYRYIIYKYSVFLLIGYNFLDFKF